MGPCDGIGLQGRWSRRDRDSAGPYAAIRRGACVRPSGAHTRVMPIRSTQPRSVTAQLTTRSRGKIHWLDGVLVDSAYVRRQGRSPAAGGYWTSRCGIQGHYTPILHRRSTGDWCKRCRALGSRGVQPDGRVTGRLPFD